MSTQEGKRMAITKLIVGDFTIRRVTDPQAIIPLWANSGRTKGAVLKN